MFIMQKTHDAIVAQLKEANRLLVERIDALIQETPAERKSRLALTSGLRDDEIAAIVAVVMKDNPAVRLPEWGIEYARQIAKAALKLAFQIKASNR